MPSPAGVLHAQSKQVDQTVHLEHEDQKDDTGGDQHQNDAAHLGGDGSVRDLGLQEHLFLRFPALAEGKGDQIGLFLGAKHLGNMGRNAHGTQHLEALDALVNILFQTGYLAETDPLVADSADLLLETLQGNTDGILGPLAIIALIDDNGGSGKQHNARGHNQDGQGVLDAAEDRVLQPAEPVLTAQQLEGNHERQAFEHSCQNDHPADAQGKVPEAFPEDAVLIQASEIADNVIPLINIGKNGTLGARFKHLAFHRGQYGKAAPELAGGQEAAHGLFAFGRLLVGAVEQVPFPVDDKGKRTGVLFAEAAEDIIHAVVIFKALAEFDGRLYAGDCVHLDAGNHLFLQIDGRGAIVQKTHGRDEADGKNSQKDQACQIDSVFFSGIRHVRLPW